MDDKKTRAAEALLRFEERSRARREAELEAIAKAPKMVESVVQSATNKYGVTQAEFILTAAGVESLKTMAPGQTYKVCAPELNKLIGLDATAVATILAVRDGHILVEYERLTPVTDAERRAFLRDPDTPENEKVAIRKAMDEALKAENNRIRNLQSPEVRDGVLKPLIALNKARRPSGMSGRQWKKFRKSHDLMRGALKRKLGNQTVN